MDSDQESSEVCAKKDLIDNDLLIFIFVYSVHYVWKYSKLMI